MPIVYKHPQHLQRTDDNIFDVLLEPSAETKFEGIYRCEGCGKFITLLAAQKTPSRFHHEHLSQQGRIQWRLCVTHRS
jgi:hypothetical protein